ncbi:MAG: response regulator [Clostridia bacterium]|nr:response regulator [Clostridia bacterium]
MDFQYDAKLIEQMLALVNTGDGEIPDDAQLFSKFVNDMPGGFFICRAYGNENGKILFVNKAMIRIFKCANLQEFKELTGNNFWGTIHADDLETVTQSVKEQYSTTRDNLGLLEYRIITKDGSVRRVEAYGHLIRSKSIGNIFYVFVSDATEKIRKRRRENLQRIKVIEGLSVNYDTVLYAEINKNKILPYRLSNRISSHIAKKLQEGDYAAFVKNYAKACVHPDDRQTIALKLSPEYISSALEETSTFYINFKSLQRGTVRYLQFKIVNIGPKGKVSQVALGCRNVDVEVLQELKQKKFLEEALNSSKLAFVAKNTFLSNMSHDMRTPLNALFGYTALAKKKLKDVPVAQTYLDKIETAGTSILELVNKVLELSYIESQECHVNETECNLQSLIEDVYHTVAPKAEHKKINISLQTGNIRNAEVYADGEKLKQVLDHVVGNAVKYTKQGGKVDITVTEQVTSTDTSTFRFIVKDTGIGISSEYLKKIFEPFEREQNTTFSGEYGSGLGLTISRHIIEMLGGTIEVTSAKGEGSTFTVTVSLKLQRKDDGQPSADTDNLLDFLKGKKILLVEDNEINLEIETDILQDLELIIEPAENGKIAVEKLSAAKEDEYLFVLMDIQMPVMDGRTAAAKIRKLNSKIAQIPIIALSANAFEVDKRLSIEAGMNDHITKPLDISVMLKSVAKVIKI